mgnify:CR=1 FL=1
MTRTQKMLALKIAVAIPFAFALLVLLGSILGGQAIVFTLGWVVIQAFSFGFILRRYGVDPDQPILMSQIIIHWLMMIMIVTILVRAA